MRTINRLCLFPGVLISVCLPLGAEVTVTFDNLTIDGTPLPTGVTLPFDSDTDGFTVGSAVGGTVAHSTLNGGTLQIAAPGGYAADLAHLDLLEGSALRTEYEKALLNGGLICFDVTVREEDQAFVDPGLDSSPNWFQIIVTGNSTADWQSLNSGWTEKNYDDISDLLGPTGFYRILRE